MRLIYFTILCKTGCLESRDQKEEQENQEEQGKEIKEGSQQGDCIDGEDNDNDGLIDCDDSGCASAPACSENNDPNDTGQDSNPDNIDDTDDTGHTNTNPSNPDYLYVDQIDVGDIFVTEIMKNPLVDEQVGEWFEIFNQSSNRINLVDLIVRDEGGDEFIVTEEVYIEAMGHFVFGANSDPSTNGGVSVNFQYERSMFALGNTGGDEIALYAGNTELDMVRYDDNFPDSEGIALSLDVVYYSASNNNTASNWCDAVDSYGIGSYGTPGTQNPTCSSSGGNTSGGTTSGGTTGGSENCNDSCVYGSDGFCDDWEEASFHGDTDYYCDPGTDCTDCGGSTTGGSTTGGTGLDIDGDGFFDSVDCDDSNEDIYPGATEIYYDGVDQDCNPNNDNDADEDGVPANVYTAPDGSLVTLQGGDCDDSNPNVSPFLNEISCDGLDNNCDGTTDEGGPDTSEGYHEDYNDAINNGDIIDLNPQSSSGSGLMEDGDTLSASGYLSYDGDVDYYSFHFEDTWGPGDHFVCYVSPGASSGIDIKITLYNEDNDAYTYDNVGSEIAEEVDSSDTSYWFGALSDNSGTYVMAVEATSGYSCQYPYTIACTHYE